MSGEGDFVFWGVGRMLVLGELDVRGVCWGSGSQGGSGVDSAVVWGLGSMLFVGFGRMLVLPLFGSFFDHFKVRSSKGKTKIIQFWTIFCRMRRILDVMVRIDHFFKNGYKKSRNRS